MRGKQWVTLFLIVGLPGAGKTTRAKELADENSAVRLTPDEWMIPLFGESQPDGKRDVLEGRLIWLALQVLQRGTSVVLDFGLWTRDERSALRWLAQSVGVAAEIVYVPIDRATQLERINRRWQQTPHETFPMTEGEVDQWRDRFDEPDEQEIRSGQAIGDPPANSKSWLDWASNRWPSLNPDGTSPLTSDV